MFRRFGLVVTLLALVTLVGAVPASAGIPLRLVLTPASGPAGTTVTVVNATESPEGQCGGGLEVGEVDVDVIGGGDEIDSSDPQSELFFDLILVPITTGSWSSTFTVPAGLAPGDQIPVTATCTELPTNRFQYAPAIFPVTAGPTNGGTTTTIGGGTTVPTTPPGGRGITPVPTPLGIQPRFTG